jgi:hypothetical protein
MRDSSDWQPRVIPKKAPSRPRRRLGRVYTAWHPVLVALLEQVLPGGFYQCISEFQLSREPLRIDVVVVRRSRPGTPPAPHLLASVVGDLADHTLVHFKGPTDELERDDARMLLAYALQYLVVAELDDPAPIALRVVASRLTPRFVEALYTVTPGMLVAPDGIPALSPEERDVFWALSEHVEQIRHPLPGQRKRHMKDENEVVESFDKALAHLLVRLPPERRFVGLTPEQMLGMVAPEQRLAGLTEAQAVLALPDAMLRALSKEYLATLPRPTRAAIERRLEGGGVAASPRKPARRRKPR